MLRTSLKDSMLAPVRGIHFCAVHLAAEPTIRRFARGRDDSSPPVLVQVLRHGCGGDFDGAQLGGLIVGPSERAHGGAAEQAGKSHTR